jgi:hypothetical protein
MRKRVAKLTGDMNDVSATLRELNRIQEEIVVALTERHGAGVTEEKRAELDARLEQLWEESRAAKAVHQTAGEHLVGNFPKWMIR